MHCPICKQALAQTDAALVCPAHHGALVTGKFLHDIEEAQIADKLPSDQTTPTTKHTIACPHCSHQMHKVDYNHTGIIIDVCTNCHYRWLDRGEADKIKNFKPTFSPQNLQQLEELDRKINMPVDPASTDLSISSWRKLRPLSQIHPFAAFAGFGIGLVEAMIKSKFLRFAVPLLLLFFGVAYYLIFISFTNT